MTASAIPPYPGVYAESTAPDSFSPRTLSKTLISDSVTGSPSSPYSGERSHTRLPGVLKWFERISPAFAVVTAKETSVGGTSSFSNDPLMESFPPIAPIPRFFCASNAPRSAASGLPHLFPSFIGFSKYSWKVRYTSENGAPEAISFETDSTTARYAP